ncbi:hypothetical protein T552_00714 [Pneumocystis carinii B80]|uniref:Restriction endonuclease type IV Mrr domain-containing protein n=1 Tax=Pneumocystis carinii (strain B80) TaxID=1408658 RepID=A0A0W4ZPB3_PNEC8|nr:hypothetical protein T552_00714 [Pneumocystis carinii B80]KTW30236.1 hypothetical protein T552_00714 [Pneumocystis carinii B80]
MIFHEKLDMKRFFFLEKRLSHTCLKTFFKYAKRVSLEPKSAYYKGVFYEYIVQDTLRKYNMELWRVGGRNDEGIDLRGYWYYEREKKKYKLPVIVQCKNEKKKIGSRYIREMNGVLSGENEGILGLISCSGYTEMARKQLLKASKAMGICIILSENGEGSLKKFIWNMEASRLIQALGVEFRYKEIDNIIQKELVLTIDGKPIKYKDYSEKENR